VNGVDVGWRSLRWDRSLKKPVEETLANRNGCPLLADPLEGVCSVGAVIYKKIINEEGRPRKGRGQELREFGTLSIRWFALGKSAISAAQIIPGGTWWKLSASPSGAAFHRFISQQIHYSLQARDAENELVPISIDQGVGILVWSPLAGGLLSGKYRRGQQAPEGTRHFNKWEEPPIHDENKLYDIIEAIVAIAEGHKVSAAQIALAYLLGRPAVTSIIIGARTEEQLIDNLAAASVTLTAEERARLDAVSQPVLLYPYWHQAKTAKERLSKADLSLLAPYIEG
jgi:hypothetical protein